MQIQVPSVPVYGQRPVRRHSRRQGCLVSVFIGILMLLCSCTASLALYVVFYPPVDIVIMGLIVLGITGVLLDLAMRMIGSLLMPWTRVQKR